MNHARLHYTWVFSIVALLGIVLLISLFLMRFALPLATNPLLLPGGLISRSQAEAMASASQGPFHFQGPTTISSYLSTYQATVQAFHSPDTFIAGPDALVWVVKIHGQASMQAPLAGLQPPVPRTYILVVDILRGTRLEMGR